MGEVILQMSKIRKSFPGVLALDDASLTLRAGEVHALMGENGAGKSTLMKCLFGVYRRESGEILLSGREVSFKSPREALDAGVAMVHQELNQALKLTVAENMWLGRLPRVRRLPFLVSSEKMRERTRRVFSELGLSIDPDVKMESLSVSERQMVEIAKAVSFDASVIVFDEPTSSLTEGEAEKLFEIIRLLKSRGTGIIYISHKMNEILRICDTVTVMRDGRHIETRAAEELSVEKIIKLMVGRDITERFPKREKKPAGELLRVEGIGGEYSRLKSASLTLRSGEVLGVAGLDGSGRTELIEAIFGLSKRRGGRIFLSGREVMNRTPAEAKKNGFALLTEERRADGIFGIRDIRDNITISSLKKYGKRIILDERQMSRDTKEYMKAIKIKAPTERTKISTLSGGNQQKVILARWLLTDPRVLLLDEPTRGIDVGAKHEIYLLINRLAESGRGVIVVSSEMPELLGISDRIIVMSGGRVAGELLASEATQEKIMELAAKYA
ncbi:MAG: sugar ABC transporter ATP-binding protein [Clostridia bacterium]|nr:sugar ABC transporter ATP-binding protein [Clostridia bacterium]